MFLRAFKKKTIVLTVLALSLVLELFTPLLIGGDAYALDVPSTPTYLTTSNKDYSDTFGVSIDTLAKEIQAYWALGWCVANAQYQISGGHSGAWADGAGFGTVGNGVITDAHVDAGVWFTDDYNSGGGVVINSGSSVGSDGAISCNSVVQTVKNLTGYSYRQLLCSSTNGTTVTKYANGTLITHEKTGAAAGGAVGGSQCSSVDGNNKSMVMNNYSVMESVFPPIYTYSPLAKDGAAEAGYIQKFVAAKLFPGQADTSFSNYKYINALKYIFYNSILTSSVCAVNAPLGSANSDYSYKNVNYVSLQNSTTAGVAQTKWMVGSSDWSGNKIDTTAKASAGGSETNTSCGSVSDPNSILNKNNQYAQDYANYLNDHPGDGTAITPGKDGGGNTSKSSCTVEQVGWIVCPVMNMMGGALDGLFTILSNMLTVNPQFVSNSGDSWRVILGVANAGLVIIFLIIIFSQITGIGIGNYGIKKMLPRLIVVAIVMQISMWLISLAVDISNIAGNGVYGLLNDMSNSTLCINTNDGQSIVSHSTKCDTGYAGVGATDMNSQASPGGIAALATTMIASTVLVGALMWSALGLLIPVLLAGLAAVAITLGILIGRLVLIVLLLVLAPLALLAMILPNTENLFKTWRKWLTSMLLLFPMVALLFGGAKLAASIWAGSLKDSGLASWLGGFFGAIIELAILLLPLFFVPKLLQGSLSAIPAIGNMASKLTSRANGGVSKSAGNIAKNTDISKAWQARQTGIQKSRDKKSEARLGNRKWLRGIAQSGFLGDERKEGRKIVDAAAAKAAGRKISDKLSGMPVAEHGQALENMAASGVSRDSRGKLSVTPEGSAAMTRMLQNGHLNDFSRLLTSRDENVREAASQHLDRFNSTRAEANVPGINIDTILNGGASTTSSTPNVGATPTQGPSNSGNPSTPTGSGPGGLILPHDEPDNPIFRK